MNIQLVIEGMATIEDVLDLEKMGFSLTINDGKVIAVEKEG